MATIKISDLKHTDSESYLTDLDLTDENIDEINGGWFFAAVTAAAAVYGVLPDAQKQWVNRRFQNAWNFIKPIPVY